MERRKIRLAEALVLWSARSRSTMVMRSGSPSPPTGSAVSMKKDCVSNETP